MGWGILVVVVEVANAMSVYLLVLCSAPSVSISVFTITEKAPTMEFYLYSILYGGVSERMEISILFF